MKLFPTLGAIWDRRNHAAKQWASYKIGVVPYHLIKKLFFCATISKDQEIIEQLKEEEVTVIIFIAMRNAVFS